MATDPSSAAADPAVNDGALSQSQAPASAPVLASRWGKGFLAVCGSLIWPGVGHVVVGSWRAGLFWILAFASLTLATFAAMASVHWLWAVIPLVLIEIPLWVAMIFHAFRRGRWSPYRLGPVWFRYLAGAALLAIAFTAQPNIRLALYFREHYVWALFTNAGAMAPTLRPGDHFIANGRIPPERWSIVVFEHPQFEPGVPIVSRLVGLPGDRIEFQKGQLTINGQIAQPPAGAGPYIEIPYTGINNRALRGRPCASCEGNPVLLGEDEYFVLGDNSSAAMDSRLWEVSADGHALGVLPGEWLHAGRVTAIYWPPSRWRVFK